MAVLFNSRGRHTQCRSCFGKALIEGNKRRAAICRYGQMERVACAKAQGVLIDEPGGGPKVLARDG